MKVPKLTDAHCGLGALQSTQTVQTVSRTRPRNPARLTLVSTLVHQGYELLLLIVLRHPVILRSRDELLFPAVNRTAERRSLQTREIASVIDRLLQIVCMLSLESHLKTP
jgi:hypothetical protein